MDNIRARVPPVGFVSQVFSGWSPPAKAFAVASMIVTTRFVLDAAGLGTISLSPLMATLITADVFILGFLLTGVMADYKESEKLPGDLAVSIGAIADECFVLWHHQQAQPAVECLHHLMDLTTSLKAWFYRREQTEALLEQVSDLGDFFAAIEPFSQANFIVRLKQEQNSISRMLVRIHTIRETSFVSSAYTMARLATFLILGGLLTLKVESWYESVFLIGVIGLFLTYLMLLIPDLDNPFDYGTNGEAAGQEVSLKPIDDLTMRLARKLDVLSPV